MAALIFDSGGLIAIERRDRRVGALLELAARGGVEATTCATCVAQVWRDPAKQALLTRALRGMIEQPFGPDRARRAGRLLARSGTSDIVDAAVIELAAGDDAVVTSDPADLRQLADAAGIAIAVLAV